MRDNANTSINSAGNSLVHFSFTSRKHNSRRGGYKLFGGFVICLVGAIQSQQFLVFLQKYLFARFFGGRTGFLPSFDF